jgi:hypothetical protein
MIGTRWVFPSGMLRSAYGRRRHQQSSGFVHPDRSVVEFGFDFGQAFALSERCRARHPGARSGWRDPVQAVHPGRLRQCGVTVEEITFRYLPHGSFNMTHGSDLAYRALMQVAGVVASRVWSG